MRIRTCVACLSTLAWLTGALPIARADDASEGRDFFVFQCVGCHAFACNKEGPMLGGLFGRKAGSVADYDGYSPELRDSGIVWSEDTLDSFFADPGKVVESTMAFDGKIEDPDLRRKTIAFLKTEDPSVNLCF